MGIANPLAPPPTEANKQTLPAVDSGMTPDQALVPSPHPIRDREGIVLTAKVARLSVELEVSVPVRNFRVRNLLALESSHLIESDWGHGEDVPLAAGGVQLAWSEFEVIDTMIAVRLTRLA